MAPIRALVVDDSAFMRHSLARLLQAAPEIEVVGTAADGAQGLEMAARLRPDIVTLDVEMPVLDGLGMLRRLMAEQPTRVVMLSSLTTDGAAVTLDALDAGAIDFVPKPSGSLSVDISRVGDELVAKVRSAAAMTEASFLRHRMVVAARSHRAAAARLAVATRPVVTPPDAAAPATGAAARSGTSGPRVVSLRPDPTAAAAFRQQVPGSRLVVVASSTGGPSALATLVGGLPDALPAAVLIVQHMPAGFTASLAARLAASGPLPCAEAATGAVLGSGAIQVAPGGEHLVGTTSGHVRTAHLPPVNGVRPSADVTLQSLAPVWGDRMLAVVLTGMGVDAREGARAVKRHGGAVFAQDEATATIYGMPAAVAEAGLADRVLPLDEIADAIAAWCGPAPH